MTVYAVWKDLEDEFPIINFTDPNWVEKEKAWVQKVVQRVKEESIHPLAGEIIRFPMGDGYAQYVIFDHKDLIHLPIGDGWDNPMVHHMSWEGIKERLEQQKALNKFFER